MAKIAKSGKCKKGQSCHFHIVAVFTRASVWKSKSCCELGVGSIIYVM
jgi:hypothetical protein